MKDKDTPTSIPDLIQKYKDEVKELEDGFAPHSSLNELTKIDTEIDTLNKVIDDLSAWLVYHY